jgi:YVTN family beta-propeller protein
MRLGIESGDNTYSYSTARQTLHVPAHTQDAVLVFWYYPASQDTEQDLQYVLLQDEQGGSEWVLRVRSDARAWTRHQYDLPADYRGRNVTIHIGVFNDGAGGPTAMYVDDVSLLACGPSPSPSPTASRPTSGAFLPVIVREFGREEVSGGAQVVAVEPWPEVQTLWTSSEAEEVPGSMQGVVTHPTHDLLYVAAGKSIWVLGSSKGKVIKRIPLQAAPRGLAVDLATNRIYASLWEVDALAVIDGSQNTLVKTVSGIPGASGVAVAADRVYVTATRSDELFVVDAQDYAIMGRIAVGDAPYAVVCDPGRQRIYVANAGSDTVSIVDGSKSAQVHVVHLGGLGHPHGLTFDPIRERLYVTYALSPKRRAIASIDTVSGQIVSRLRGNEKLSLFGAYGIVVDPLRGWIYTTTSDGVLVLAGETLRVMQRVAGVGPTYAFGLCADPLEPRVYVADAGHGRLATVGW